MAARRRSYAVPGSYSESEEYGKPNLSTKTEILIFLAEYFGVQHDDVEFDEGLPGSLKLIIRNIDKQEQMAIHDNLQPRLPAGLRLDVFRKAPGKSTVKRPPKWV